MNKKTMQRMRKLQALAERGVGGEKDTAEKMMQKMLEKNGIHSLYVLRMLRHSMQNCHAQGIPTAQSSLSTFFYIPL